MALKPLRSKQRTKPLLLLLLLSLSAAFAQTVDPTTLTGKVLLGYQGWFRCPGGGTSGVNWSHWANGAPSAATIVIDMYPDLREFEPGESCIVPGMTVGSQQASLFSSAQNRTVARHFQWMQQYGLDGVLVQRFVTDIPGSRAAGDVVLRNVMAAAERYGRVFAIEYDISGANAANLLSVLQQDWQYLTGTLGVTAHPRYLHHEGKPVLSVWGIGLNDATHPPKDPDAALALIQWFREQAQVAYLGGTPAYWRTLSNDAATDARWAAVYQAMDGIQPWTVGRYANAAEVDRWKTDRIVPDLAATAARQQFYMPVIFPGFSWYNLNRTAPQNQIPRRGGQFLWQQAYNARAAGAQMLKIAMFDEVNESTAMFKVAARREDAPDQGYWLTLDADGFTLPSDWYLRLAGEITRVFHGDAAPAAVQPVQPGPPWPDPGGHFGIGVAAVTAPAAIVSAYLPEAAAGMTVLDSSGVARAAEVLYASATQINFVIPPETAMGNATLLAERADHSLAYGAVTVAALAPQLFTPAIVRVTLPDGSQTTTSTAGAIDLGPPGAVVALELYGTGMRGHREVSAFECTIGGAAAPVLYAGPQSVVSGLDQVNVLLSRSLAGSGSATVQLRINGVAANPIAIRFR